MSDMSDDDWRKKLTPEQYQILRRNGTELPGSSPLNIEKRTGVFRCAGCGAPLFVSSRKYDSGSGWPSFWDSVDDALDTETDRTHGMMRTAISCSHCGGHLGHVFPDGPPPTGLRYCVNGGALTFVPKE